ncbi:MAG: hypothetical protein A3G75_12175 [Verrucomicrobia bacterium RIFCSPLOWO2_12_FULL_64_8]|nr:MAG: hypothetical protein A3G75_12175 [Verrucomicrobia bacterium RIFCSPLOWO2_12_FULL_64_8]
MTLDLERMLESKRARRRQLAARPLAEKLAMLDALRERALTLRGASRRGGESGSLKEEPGAYPARRPQ